MGAIIVAFVITFLGFVIMSLLHSAGGDAARSVKKKKIQKRLEE